MDFIPRGSIDQSIIFALKQAALDPTNFKYTYTRWNQGDGSSWETATVSVSGELAAINSAHTDNEGKYMSAVSTEGGYYQFRLDIIDNATAIGKEFLAISLFDESDNEISHRIFKLKNFEGDVYNGCLYYDISSPSSGSIVDYDGTYFRKCSDISDLISLAENTGIKHIKVIGDINPDVAPDDSLDYCIFEGMGANASFTGDSTLIADHSLLKNFNYIDAGGATDDLTEMRYENSGIASTASELTLTISRCWMADVSVVSWYGKDGGRLKMIDSNSLDAYFEINGSSNGAFEVDVSGHKGDILISELINGSQNCRIHMMGGTLTIDNLCTSGNVILTGWGHLIDNSSSSVNSDFFQELPVDFTTVEDLLNTIDGKVDDIDALLIGVSDAVNDISGIVAVIDDRTALIQEVTDVLSSVDGVSLEDREKYLLAYIKGKITRTGNAFTYFAQNGTTALFTLTGNINERIPS